MAARARDEVNAEITEFIGDGGLLQMQDFDARVRQYLHSLHSAGGQYRVRTALQALRTSTAKKDRQSVKKWPNYILTLLRKNDREAREAQVKVEAASRTAVPATGTLSTAALDGLPPTGTAEAGARSPPASPANGHGLGGRRRPVSLADMLEGQRGPHPVGLLPQSPAHGLVPQSPMSPPPSGPPRAYTGSGGGGEMLHRPPPSSPPCLPSNLEAALAQAAAPSAPTLDVGTRVFVDGLKRTPEFNRHFGIIEGYDAEQRRYVVRLVTREDQQPVIAKLRREHLMLPGAPGLETSAAGAAFVCAADSAASRIRPPPGARKSGAWWACLVPCKS